MTAPNDPPNYVSAISGSVVRVKHVTPTVAHLLAARGGTQRQIEGRTVWQITAADDREMGLLLGQLRDAGASFGGAPAGWPPADVFADLRDQGLVQGSFQQVVWYGPDRWATQTR